MDRGQRMDRRQSHGSERRYDRGWSSYCSRSNRDRRCTAEVPGGRESGKDYQREHRMDHMIHENPDEKSASNMEIVAKNSSARFDIDIIFGQAHICFIY